MFLEKKNCTEKNFRELAPRPAAPTIAEAGEKFNKIVLECSAERDKFHLVDVISIVGLIKLAQCRK